MMYAGYGLGFGLFALTINILWWILIISLIVGVVRAIRHEDGPHAHKDALDVLRKRYAKGEIEKEEFETKKKDLES